MRPSIAWMVTLISAAPLAAAPKVSPWTAPRWVPFGSASEGWILLEVNSRSITSLHLPPTLRAEQVACSPDGRTVALVARGPSSAHPLLFRWDVDKASADLIGEAQGYHGDPAVTPDGAWVYFVHHPAGGGPAGKHAAQEYGQIYRVRSDGRDLQTLTSDSGCHLGPAILAPGRIAMLHTHCDLDREVVILDLSKGRQSQTVPFGNGQMNELAISPDGAWLLTAAPWVDRTVIQRRPMQGSGAPLRFVATNMLDPVRPQFGSSSEEFLYQSHGAVHMHRADSDTILAPLQKEALR